MIPPPPAPIEVNSKYHAEVAKLLMLTATEQTAREQTERNDKGVRVTAFVMQGTVYDRIGLIVNVPVGEKRLTTRGVARVFVFIDKKTGTILGRKSDILPHPKAYYGTIYTADKWYWGAELPVPRDMTEADVHIKSTHGRYIYYAAGPAVEGEEVVEEGDEPDEAPTGEAEEIDGEENTGDDNGTSDDDIDAELDGDDIPTAQTPATPDVDPVDDGLEDWERGPAIGEVVGRTEPAPEEGTVITNPEFHGNAGDDLDDELDKDDA